MAALTALAQGRVGCSVELVEHQTGCTVVLVGCFHGSASSAADVEHALQLSTCHPQQTDVVVLELCAQRFDQLINKRDTSNSNWSDSESDETSNATRQSTPWIWRYVRMVQTMAEKQGWPTACVAAVLGAASGLQTEISNLQPGLEFKTAAVIAETEHMHIVLADQDVDTTLVRMGQLPDVSVTLWRDFLFTASTYDDTFGVEAVALRTALLGDSSLQDYQVTLPSFLTRSNAAIKDLLRLTLTPIIALQALNIVLTESMASLLTLNPAFAAATDASPVAETGAADPVAAIAVTVANAALLVLAYLSVALPATRVVIRERDDVLTAGIRAACQQLAPPGGRVVAVLGLLHVNGVAQRLLRVPDAITDDDKNNTSAALSPS